MKRITDISRWLDSISEWLGRITAWSALLMVLVTCFIVIMRYLFESGSIAVQESVIYLNAILFMMTAGFTLRHNGHVRVDILYGKASIHYRAWVDLLGTLLLLLPVAFFILVYSWDYVAAAWRIREDSRESGGLPFVYLLKTMLPLLSILLILQGIAEVLKNIAILRDPDSRLAEHKGEEEPAAL